jgi:hypothetical protein
MHSNKQGKEWAYSPSRLNSFNQCFCLGWQTMSNEYVRWNSSRPSPVQLQIPAVGSVTGASEWDPSAVDTKRKPNGGADKKIS